MIMCLLGLENDDELQCLDEEIGALEESNAQMESEMVQLHAEISGMESRIQQHQQENQVCVSQIPCGISGGIENKSLAV